MFRPGERDDLQAIAEAWGIPVATTVWVIVHDQLAKYRRCAPELGEHGLAIAAATVVLRQRRAAAPRPSAPAGSGKGR